MTTHAIIRNVVRTLVASLLAAAVVILNGTSAASAQQPQYQVGGVPMTPLQMSVLQPSARTREQQRLSRQTTMDASRRPAYPDPSLNSFTGY